ncbi:MAG: hypothetical protein IPG04_40095 [Polyangiaceae bacterium]|nr:hypothetical protein [Polyangiaceae bacterium]
MKYLTPIRAVTLLTPAPARAQEHCAPAATPEYAEVTRQDVELATRPAQAVLPKSLTTRRRRRAGCSTCDGAGARAAWRDGAPQSEVRFTRRELREWTCWGQT